MRPVIGVCGLVVCKVLPLDEPHSAQTARVRSLLWCHMDTHMHTQILFAIKLFAARVTGKVFHSNVMFDNMLLQRVFILECGRTLGTGKYVLCVHLHKTR